LRLAPPQVEPYQYHTLSSKQSFREISNAASVSLTPAFLIDLSEVNTTVDKKKEAQKEMGKRKAGRK